MSTGPITPKLVGIAGPLKDSIFSLEQQQFSICRDPSNELSLTDRSVSRRHCVLEKTANGFLMRDLGSLGGTLVNGAVTAQALLQHGDRIAVGSSAFKEIRAEWNCDGWNDPGNEQLRAGAAGNDAR